MKYEGKMNSGAKLLVAASMAAFLSACGGGGGGSSGAAAPATGASAPGGASNPGGAGGSTTTNAIDPYTGVAATGTATQQVSGAVVSGLTTGATVTAYTLNADGTNGNAIGSAVTDAQGAFSMTLTAAPAGMVRFVAVGGTFASEADGSTQKSTSLELVAPYVTTTLNTFVVTPLTHYASQRMAFLVGQGQTPLTAYATASSSALQIITGNDAIASSNRTHGGVDYLSIVPGSTQDTLNSYADALTGLEYYGVKFDLPSHTTVRIFVDTAVPGLDGVNDKTGQPENVGQWSSGIFDESLPLTVTTMTGGFSVQDGVTGIVQQMIAAQACASGDHSSYYLRFPLAAGQADFLDTATCAAYTNNIAAIKAKIATNNRTKFVS